MPQPDPVPAASDDLLASPVGAAKLDRVLRQMRLAPRHRVLDVGCGSAGLLVRAHELAGCAGVGVDKDPEVIRQGMLRVAARTPGADIVLRAVDATQYASDGPFDAAVCVGATHVYGGYGPTLAALKKLAGPGGYVLVGDLYWKKEPAEEYLAVLGEEPDSHLDHRGNVMAGVEEGLTPLYTAVSSEDDWDHFEGRFWARRLRAEPGEAPDAKLIEKRQRALRWLDAYLTWGRDTLGFALYLFQT